MTRLVKFQWAGFDEAEPNPDLSSIKPSHYTLHWLHQPDENLSWPHVKFEKSRDVMVEWIHAKRRHVFLASRRERVERSFISF